MAAANCARRRASTPGCPRAGAWQAVSTVSNAAAQAVRRRTPPHRWRASSAAQDGADAGQRGPVDRASGSHSRERIRARRTGSTLATSTTITLAGRLSCTVRASHSTAEVLMRPVPLTRSASLHPGTRGTSAPAADRSAGCPVNRGGCCRGGRAAARCARPRCARSPTRRHAATHPDPAPACTAPRRARPR